METSDNITYVINSIEDLVTFSNSVNSGTTYENKIVVLEKTLDFTNDASYGDPNNTALFLDYNGDGTTEGIKAELTKGRGFIPIGNAAVYNPSTIQISGNYFKGTFDGNNKSIQGLLINVEETSDYLTAGFFGILNGTVKNFILAGNVSITNNTTNIDAKSCVGSIAGQTHNAIIKNCSNTCTINQTQNLYSEIYIGGLVGFTENDSRITKSSNYGTLNIGGGRDLILIGGISGQTENSKIDNCINYANLTSIYTYTTTAEYNFVFVGGMTGKTLNNCILYRNCNLGNVTNKGGGSRTSLRTGGIVAMCGASQVRSNVNKGNIEVDSTYNGTRIVYGACGQIVGELCEKTYLEYNYAVGTYTSVRNDGAYGGIYGVSTATSSKPNQMNYCYYLGDVEQDGGTGVSKKNEAQMKSDSFAQMVGPDFMKDPTGGYPIFETRYSYEYGSAVNAPVTTNIDVKKGDLVIASITTRVPTSNATFSSGWNIMDNPQQSINQGSAYQYLTYAYKNVTEDGNISLTVSQNVNEQIQVILIAINGGGTPQVLSDVEQKGTRSFTMTKPCNELVIWTFNSIWSGENYIVTSNPHIPRIGIPSMPEYQRLVNFVDYNASASQITIYNPHVYAQTHISAIKIIQN